MRRKILPHLTYANVVSSAALFLVVAGGAAYAANTIGSPDVIDESLLSQDIRNGEVKLADVGQGAVATDELANGQVKTADIGDGEVRTADVLNDNLTGGDISPNSLKGVDIDESTLSNIGGGGPAGGDLTGTYPNPTIKANAVGSGKVANDSLTGADINESLLNGTSGRIHIIGGGDSFPVPGLWLGAFCEPTLARVFITVHDPGTDNAIIGGRGVDPEQPDGDFLETTNDVRIDGGVLQASSTPGDFFTVLLVRNEAGSAQSESQIIVDAGGKTYSLALHIYTQDAGAYCEFLGTATVTE